MNILPLEFQRDGLSIRGLLYLPNGVGPFNLVIVAHGFSSSLRVTSRIAEVLSKDNLAAYAFDFTGGSADSSSDGSVLDMSVLTQKADLLTIIDAFTSYDSIKSIYLLGSSQGGLVAAMAAKEREQSLKGMILFYPAFSIPDRTRREFPRKEDIRDESIRLGRKVGRVYHEAVYDMDAFEEIRGFSKPVLLIHGDKDDLVPLEYSVKAASLYPDSRLYIVKGAGHIFDRVTFSRACDEIADFIKREEGEPAFTFLEGN